MHNFSQMTLQIDRGALDTESWSIRFRQNNVIPRTRRLLGVAVRRCRAYNGIALKVCKYSMTLSEQNRGSEAKVELRVLRISSQANYGSLASTSRSCSKRTTQ